MIGGGGGRASRARKDDLRLAHANIVRQLADGLPPGALLRGQGSGRQGGNVSCCGQAWGVFCGARAARAEFGVRGFCRVQGSCQREWGVNGCRHCIMGSWRH